MAWTKTDIAIELHDDGTEDTIVTVEVWTPAGVMYILAEVSEKAGELTLKGAHFSGLGPNQLGLGNLKVIAAVALDYGGYDAIVIEGATRTTGANPGHTPRRLRFPRSRSV